ncbi:MAG: translesion error-prone DNA polymerase V autoproteolytic subunit [Muribaculaceae bacterium]|nr:translesion error-prone DNA polymerase V autoproteolytic subunit [Muribaculaceae bacterium]
MKSIKELEIFSGDFSSSLSLPYAEGGVRAGFPSPAQDYMDRTLDFNRELISHPAATFYARVVGLSMIEAGIDEGDIIVIDRSLTPRQNDIVVAFINGEFSMKYLDLTEKESGKVWLRPGNPDFSPIEITPDDEFTVWGVVAKVIKNFR